MRTLVLKLAAALLMAGVSAHAQTWSNPVQLYNGDSFFSDSCSAQPEMLYMDDGNFPIFTPAMVYSINQIAVFHLHQPPPQLHPWSVTMTPYGADLALWVCQSKYGELVSGCVDMSDNYGVGAWEHVTVPAQWGWYYVVVTGSVGQQYPMCGAYALSTYME